MTEVFGFVMLTRDGLTVFGVRCFRGYNGSPYNNGDGK